MAAPSDAHMRNHWNLISSAAQELKGRRLAGSAAAALGLAGGAAAVGTVIVPGVGTAIGGQNTSFRSPIMNLGMKFPSRFSSVYGGI